MLIIDEKISDEQRVALDQYYSSGYKSLTDFLNQNLTVEVKRFEKDPNAAWSDFILNNDRDDFLNAKEALLEYICSKFKSTPIDYLEFGVRSGRSMRIVLKNNDNHHSQFFGFDTFTGLPEGWVPAYGNRGVISPNPRLPGEMAAKQPIFDDIRVRLVPGLFQETFYHISGRLRDCPKIINIDGDTYTAALYNLCFLDPYLSKGDIVYFDEFADNINEFAAFNDYVRSYYRKDSFRLIGVAYDAFAFEFVGPARHAPGVIKQYRASPVMSHSLQRRLWGAIRDLFKLASLKFRHFSMRSIRFVVKIIKFFVKK